MYIRPVTVPSVTALFSLRRLLRWIKDCIELAGACFMVLSMSALLRRDHTTCRIAMWGGQRLTRIADWLPH